MTTYEAPIRLAARNLAEVPQLAELLRRGTAVTCIWGPSGGIVGWGESVRIDADSWDDLANSWQQLSSMIPTAVGFPAPRAITTLVFDQTATAWPSTLILPREAVIVENEQAWHLRLDGEEPLSLPELRPQSSAVITLDLGNSTNYQDRVAKALAMIDRGELHKVVVATPATGSLPEYFDPADIAAALAETFSSCWIYCIDGLVGASPELLTQVIDQQLTARVLAGTVDNQEPKHQLAVTKALSVGGKNYREHLLARDSARNSLQPLVTALKISEQPFALVLPNVTHLASDITADLNPELGIFDVLKQLHPTAAVGGTPTDIALACIREWEPDRGRYAGPVGWLDTCGNGAFAIALRGGQVNTCNNTFSAWVGAGIVAGSTPEDEWLEINAKLRPMKEALS
ncbi:MAG: isochorismate synthase [Propionibacteriaceae bacterium]